MPRITINHELNFVPLNKGEHINVMVHGTRPGGYNIYIVVSEEGRIFINCEDTTATVTLKDVPSY